MSGHKHKWRAQYTKVNGADIPLGMVCVECGSFIEQADVEKIVNGFFEMIDDLGIIANEILVKMNRLIEGRIL